MDFVIESGIIRNGLWLNQPPVSKSLQQFLSIRGRRLPEEVCRKGEAEI